MPDHNDFDRDRERDWDRDRERERGINRAEWQRSAQGRSTAARGDFERENRERWDDRDRDRWSGAQDWDRERRGERWSGESSGRTHEGSEEWRRNQPWAGEHRQGDFREQGDWGNQGRWGAYGNRADYSRENEWNRRSSSGAQTGGGISQWGGGSGQYGRGSGQWGGGMGSYGSGGMGSYSGGMGSYGPREERERWGERGGLGERERERGRFAGRGPKGYQRSDERIREDVNERLTDHPDVDAGEIEVQVKDGEVTLTGTVDRRETKRMAEDVAESVSGVKQVHNQLRIGEHATTTQHGSQQTSQPTSQRQKS